MDGTKDARITQTIYCRKHEEILQNTFIHQQITQFTCCAMNFVQV